MKCRKARKVLYFYILGFSAFVLSISASLRMTGTRSVLFTVNFSKLPAPLKIQLMAACLQAIVRGMFEDMRGYKLSYIAAQIKVRSTLQNKRKP